MLSIQSRCRRTERFWWAAISRHIGGQTRNFIARLNPKPAWLIRLTRTRAFTVDAIAVQADGKILVGGAFIRLRHIGGQPRNLIARLDPTTGLADSFDPNANNEIRSIAVQADGKILAGGIS